jgi:hypothetical protein
MGLSTLDTDAMNKRVCVVCVDRAHTRAAAPSPDFREQRGMMHFCCCCLPTHLFFKN